MLNGTTFTNKQAETDWVDDYINKGKKKSFKTKPKKPFLWLFF